MQYETKGRETLGEGSIIVCLDQSGSMRSDEHENMSKAFTLALASIAKRQRRNFVFIPFAHEVGRITEFPRGNIPPSEMVRIAKEFLGGGTSFYQPLEESLKTLKRDRYKDADIVFITDGVAYLNNGFIGRFLKEKEELEFNVLSLSLTHRISTLEEFSDRVIEIRDFDDEGAFEAFEI